MTLIFNTNTIPATGGVTVFQLKTLLKSVGWVVKASSDGTTFNSTSDIIVTGATGAGGMANTNAWFRIQQPNGVREFVFQCNAVSNANWKIKYSAASKFTGGSPSASVLPTAADEQFLIGLVGSFSGWLPTDNTYRWHAFADNSDGYGFMATTVLIGNVNTSMTGILLDPMQAGTFDPQDQDPYIVYVRSSSAWNSSTITGTTSGVTAWYKYGFGDAQFVFVAAQRITLGTTSIFPGNAGSDIFTGKNFLFPVIWARVDQPNTATPPGIIKGVSSYLMYPGLIMATGDMMSLNINFDKVVFDSVVFPWNGSPILI